jgi:hypothetical protein
METGCESFYKFETPHTKQLYKWIKTTDGSNTTCRPVCRVVVSYHLSNIQNNCLHILVLREVTLLHSIASKI